MNPKENLKAVLEKLKGEVSNRDYLERLLTRRLGTAFKGNLDELLDLLGDPPSIGNVPQKYWDKSGQALRSAVTEVFEMIYVQQATALIEQVRIGVDWALVNQNAVSWAGTHAGNLIDGLQTTTQTALRNYVSRYYQDGWTIDELEKKLVPLFGEQRARTIAITETTNAATQSELAMVNYFEASYPLKFSAIWITANDDRVCEICAPLDGKPITNGDYPPAHVNCRCEVAWEAKNVS